MRPQSDQAGLPARATLEVVGVPATVVSVFTESAWDAAALPIFEGRIPAAGCLRLRVPRMPMRVVAAAFGVVAVRFAEGQEVLRLSLVRADPG